MNAPLPYLGLRYGLSNAAYHASPGLSNSGLSDLLRSPWHFYSLHLDPNRPAEDQTAAQLAGTLAHTLILEPETFEQFYAVGPEVTRSTKVWKEFEASNPGRMCIKPSELEPARLQATSVRSHPRLGQLLSAGRAEVSAYWTDLETGVLCRCRPDWVHTSTLGAILVDVKTCGDARPEEFTRQIARMGYHRQAAWYSEGYAQASGEDVIGFIFAAVEDKWPYACSAVMLDDESLARGAEQNRALVRLYAQCMERGEWPAYSQEIEVVNLPAWA